MSLRLNVSAMFGIILLLSPVGEVLAQTATVDVNSQKQLIRGFGGMNHPIWAGDLTADQRTTAFGNGQGQLGLTVLRIFISDNQNDWSKEVPTAKRAIELGAIVFASPWNPPSSMCENVNGKKRLKYDQYGAYATYLSDFNTYMKNNGVNLYAVGFQNEPDYANEWTAWTVDEVYNFVLNNAGSIGADRVITAESFNYAKSYYDKILNDPKALANVDILGTHLYGTAVSAFPYPLFDQKGTGQERWMTEHYTDSKNDADLWPMALDVAYEIHNAMVEAQFNAYTWWYIRRFYGPIKEDGTISKRGYCMAQFSKFVRPGFVRVDATKNPAPDVYVSAYKSDNEVVIVIVNRSTSSKPLTLSISGSNISSFDRFTTSSSKNLSDGGALNASSGLLSVTLDSQSVTTLRGTGPGGSAGAGGSTGAGAGGATGRGGFAGVAGSAGASGSKGVATLADSGGSKGLGGFTGVGGRTGVGGPAGTAGFLGIGGSTNTAVGANPPGVDASAVTSSDNGCGCRVMGKSSNSKPFAFLVIFGALALGTVRPYQRIRERTTRQKLVISKGRAN